MTVAEQQRAAAVLKHRMDELGLTPVTLADKAGVNPTTVRRLLRAETVARESTRARLAAALEWPPGHGMKLARRLAVLEEIPTNDLLDELRGRCGSNGSGSV